jgi:two-component system CheB/CheR fusion protein
MSHRNGLRVLLVEPEDDLCSAFSWLLELLGCPTSCVRTGADALARVGAGTTDVILSELVLPDMSGLELAKALRSTPQAENILLIALTGYHRNGIEADAIQAGFARYLLKPVMFEDVVRILCPFAVTRGRTLAALEPLGGAAA